MHPLDPGGGLHGLYLRALCEGLSLALDPYRKTLLDLEEELMADPHLSAAHVQSSLEEVSGRFGLVVLCIWVVLINCSMYLVSMLHC